MDRQVKLKLSSALAAMILTLAAAWAGLKGTSILLFYVGIIGAIPMVLIEGVHRGEHI